MLERSINSSFISKATYEPDTQRMTITMGANTYDFDGVPEHVYSEFCDCESAGKYYAANIKGQYPVRTEQDAENAEESAG